MAVSLIWTTIVSMVILTTMQVQDLKDQAGDKKKGRRTAPLVLGEKVARLSISVSVLLWSLVCTIYW
jgi:1,4-dihydroxy-2-naphthoate octaprenyltransferase